jgi:hypothetical protein
LPDGRTGVTGGQEASLDLWDLASGEQRPVSATKGHVVREIVADPSGQRILTVGA